jgi:hypothetical protein
VEEHDIPSRGRPALWGLLAVVLVGGGVAAWLMTRTGAPPTGVLVAVDGCSDACREAVRRELSSELAELGFTVYPREEDVVPSVSGFDAWVDAARKGGVRYVAHVSIEVKSEREGLRPGTTFVVAEATSRAGSIDPEESAPREGERVSFGAEGESRDDALSRMTDAFAHVAFAHVAGDLVDMPLLERFLESPEGLEELETKARLDDALERRAGQARTRARLDETCAESSFAMLADENQGPAPVTCTEVGCTERYLFGLTSDGARALVHVESPTLFVPFATSPAPRSAETVERIELVPLEGGEPRVLAEASNFFGYGSLSSDGKVAAFVEQGDGRFGLVALDTESGARRVLHLVENPRLIIQARVAPDGRFIAFHQQAFSRAHTELAVVPSTGGEVGIVARRMRMAEWVEVPLAAGEAPRLALALDGTASYEGTPSLVLAVPEDPSTLVPVDVGGRMLREIAGSYEGALVIVTSPSRDIETCELGIRDPATLELRYLPLAHCIDDARVTPSGRLVATAVVTREGDPSPTDPEVVLVDLETGALDQRTVNDVRERYPRAAGRRLVFERLGTSQFRGVHPNAICFAPH